MYRKNGFTLVIGLLSLLSVVSFVLSSCVAADGTVYAFQPVAAPAANAATVEAGNKQFILDYFAALNQDKSPATVEKYVVDEVLKEHINFFEAASLAISLLPKRCWLKATPSLSAPAAPVFTMVI